MKLKRKDIQIANLLRNTIDIDQVARKLNLPKSTVYYHFDKLLKAGLIRGYKVVLDKSGSSDVNMVFVLIALDKVDQKTKREFYNQLKLHKNIILDVYGISGGWDFLVSLMGTKGDIEKFLTYDLHGFKHIKKTYTLFVLENVNIE